MPLRLLTVCAVGVPHRRQFGSRCSALSSSSHENAGGSVFGARAADQRSTSNHYDDDACDGIRVASQRDRDVENAAAVIGRSQLVGSDFYVPITSPDELKDVMAALGQIESPHVQQRHQVPPERRVIRCCVRQHI
jgi:hypothetical protein